LVPKNQIAGLKMTFNKWKQGAIFKIETETYTLKYYGICFYQWLAKIWVIILFFKF
jgi:hypothetical protein